MSQFDDIQRGESLIDIKQIDDFARQVAEGESAHIAAINQMRGEADKAAERTRSRLSTENLEDLSASARDEFKQAVEKQAAKDRRAVIDTFQERHDRLLEKVETRARDLETAAQVWPSPAAMISGQGIGDSRRTDLLAQVKAANNGALKTLSRQAIATGDQALAAAILDTVIPMPHSKRPFEPAGFASKMVGEDHEKLIVAAKRARLAVDSMREDFRTEMKGKTRNPVQKISRGLRARALAPQL